MLKLIKNEHLKIYYKKSNRILFLLYALGCFLLSLMTRNILATSGQDESFMDYFVFSSSFLFLVQFVVVILAGSIVSNEFDWGTIKFLLIRAVPRSRILLSKYITVLFIGAYFLLLYLVLALIFGLILFGISDITGDFENLRNIALKYGSSFFEISVISTLAFSLSTIFRSSVIAIGTSIFLILTGRTFVEVLSHYEISWGKYVLFANTNLTQFFSGNRPLFSDMSLMNSILTSSIYLIVFIGAAWVSFTKRDVSI